MRLLLLLLGALALCATAPAVRGAGDLTALMSKKGCAAFANLLASTADVAKTFEGNVGGGLTAFCPVDQATKAFMPRFKNLTADGKISVLLYHGFPVYMSMEMLRTNNGVVNTLATDGATRNYNLTVQNDGDAVTLDTTRIVATITGTVVDEQPLAAYTIDRVLEPPELFKPPKKKLAPAPAPAPVPAADAPSAEKLVQPPAPAGAESAAGNQTASDDNAGAVAAGGRWIAFGAAMAAGILVI